MSELKRVPLIFGKGIVLGKSLFLPCFIRQGSSKGNPTRFVMAASGIKVAETWIGAGCLRSWGFINSCNNSMSMLNLNAFRVGQALIGP